MRDIKFRAWDKEDEEFIYAEPLYGFFPNLCWAEENPKGFKKRYADIQMFTGLLDKNGKEIYEGDLVQYYQKAYYSKNLVKMGHPVLIEWRSGDKYQGYGLGKPRVVEVIGNIYENPELLK